MKRSFFTLLAAVFWLAACGQSGDLYRPDAAPEQEPKTQKKDAR